MSTPSTKYLIVVTQNNRGADFLSAEEYASHFHLLHHSDLLTPLLNSPHYTTALVGRSAESLLVTARDGTSKSILSSLTFHILLPQPAKYFPSPLPSITFFDPTADGLGYHVLTQEEERHSRSQPPPPNTAIFWGPWSKLVALGNSLLPTGCNPYKYTDPSGNACLVANVTATHLPTLRAQFPEINSCTLGNYRLLKGETIVTVGKAGLAFSSLRENKTIQSHGRFSFQAGNRLALVLNISQVPKLKSDAFHQGLSVWGGPESKPFRTTSSDNSFATPPPHPQSTSQYPRSLSLFPSPKSPPPSPLFLPLPKSSGRLSQQQSLHIPS